jgi:hypothetical protein
MGVSYTCKYYTVGAEYIWSLLDTHLLYLLGEYRLVDLSHVVKSGECSSEHGVEVYQEPGPHVPNLEPSAFRR